MADPRATLAQARTQARELRVAPACGRLPGIRDWSSGSFRNARERISRRQVTRCRQEQWSFAVVVALGKAAGEIPIVNRESIRLLDLQLLGKAHLRGFN